MNHEEQLLSILIEESKLYNLVLLNQYNKNDIYHSYMNLPKFNSELQTTQESAIPRIMHYIWFTKEHNPKQIPESFLANLKLELAKLHIYNQNAPETWKVKLWISCEEVIAPSLENIAKLEYPIEIIKWQLEDFGHNRSPLQEIVTNLINANNGMGAAYDIARFIIAEKYGGFLPDFDYNTGNSTEIIVQRGYHSITATSEIDYFGFKPQHKLLLQLNDEIYNLFQIAKNHNMSSIVSSMSAYALASHFSYGPCLTAMILFLGKEDLYAMPQCNICDDKSLVNESKLDSYGMFVNNDNDNNGQCSINPLEICYVGDHRTDANSLGGLCNIYINNTYIDFGHGTAGNPGSWGESWQNV